MRPEKTLDELSKENTSNIPRKKFLKSEIVTLPRLKKKSNFYVLKPYFMLLSSLYKALETTFLFLKKRNLSFIFEKHKKTLEKSLNRTIELSYLYDLEIIAKGHVFIDKINDYTIIEIESVDIDLILYKFKDLDLLKKEVVIEKVEVIKEVSKEGLSVLERIKLKEEKRKQAFLESLKHEDFDYFKKICDIFKMTKKKAIRLNELIFRVGGVKPKENILNNLKDKFILKNIQNEEYIVKLNI